MWCSSAGRLQAAALLLLMASAAWASGPRFVTGPPFFPGTQSLPIGWKQSTLRYSTDPGNLSAAVPHAAADALVAAAAGVWNLPVASITIAQGAPLAEHVSGADVYLDAGGMEYPADVMSSNAAAVPIAVIYDTDGSVTDTLLGSGASAPAGCNANAVTSTVDAFDPAGYIVHAIIVLNGRCTGPAAAQQMQMQYKLERAFGRVLGLAWSQNNDNVFTGSPTPTYNQALHWPIMHPLEIYCGLYTYQCLPNPFSLRPDDIASMVAVYPIGANATPAPGKQVSLADANFAAGAITFPDGQGMAGVNVLVKRQGYNEPLDAWSEASAVTGNQFRQGDVSPFVAAGTSAVASMGTVGQRFAGYYTVAYLPFDPGPAFDNLITSAEAVNPLYAGAYGLNAYGLNPVAPSGSLPTPLTTLLVPAGYASSLAFPITDAAVVCGTGTDGTAADPAQIATTGWWNATICGYGHASYFGVDVKPGRTFTVEATALDGNGLASNSKLMPVIGLFAPTDLPGSLPSLGVAAAAFQGLAYGTTALAGASGSLTRVTLGVADQRGDGRPDYPYQGRMFYADSVEPVRVPGAGGTITITGMGFRAGNAVLVNGVAANVTKWSANTLVATVPAMSAAMAIDNVAVDVEVMDRGTGASSTMSAALTYEASATLPNAMILLSAPSGTLPVGLVASVPLAIRVVAADGITPVAGDQIIFSTTAGRALFGLCGGTTCTTHTDATGTVTTTVTPLAAGPVTLQAADGSVLQTASFLAQSQPSRMAVLLAPTGAFPVGTSITTPFVVRVYGADGAGLVNQTIHFTIAGGSAVYTQCNASTCTGTTDGTGAYVIFVTPTGAGTVTLEATDDSLSQQASFTAIGSIDTMTLFSAPAATGFVGDSLGSFSVQLLRGDGVPGDGVTGDNGEPVTFTLPAGVSMSGCVTSPCQLFTGAGGVTGGNVRASAPGTYTVQARYGALVQSVSFTVKARTLSLAVLSAPAGPVLVGTTAATPFSVQLLGLDGVTPMVGYDITVGGPEREVVLQACHDGTCEMVTDAHGTVSTLVTPLQTGTIPLSAAFSPLVASASVTGVAATDSLVVLAQPGGATLYPGNNVSFRVQLLKPDGVIAESGETVTFTVTNGQLGLSGCNAAVCPVTTDQQGIASLTGTTSSLGSVTVTASYGSLAQAMSFNVSALPDVMQLLGAPASGSFTGVVAAAPFSVRLLLGDGITPAAGHHVTLSVANSAATFSACAGLSSCALLADASGTVSSFVTPIVVGNIALLASEGSVTQGASFTAVARPDVLEVVSAPGNGALVGDVAATNFAVRVLTGDGVTPLAGKAVVLSVTAGTASLQACGAAQCTLLSDANGLVSTGVSPLVAGSITLLAADGAITQAVSFTASNKADVLQLVSAPANGSFVGSPAQTSFAVQVLLGTGAAAGAGKNVTVSVTRGSAQLGACANASSCTLVTDAEGQIATAVTPLAAGQIVLAAVDGSAILTATFTAVSRPDVLQLVSAPADGALVGSVAATPFALRVLAGDGSPASDRTVVLSVTAGSATLNACGAASCTLSTDANGLASSSVTPLAAGKILLLAADGAVTQSTSFQAVSRPDVLQVVSAPTNGAFVGVVASVSFAVRVLAGDGVTPVAGRAVVFSVTGGSAAFGQCAASSCAVFTDASGLASTLVTPLAAGAIVLQAADGALTQAANFTAVNRPDILSIVSVPANGSWVGEAAAAPFGILLTQADGVTPAAGKTVSFAGSGIVLGACGAANCTATTDANGRASTSVTPLNAGVTTLVATAEGLQQSASFTAANKPDVLAIQSVPANGAVAGSVAAIPLALQVLTGSGVPAGGRNVTVKAKNALLAACNAATCTLTTDAHGLAATGVTPLNAGIVSLLASDGNVTATASFLAAARPDVLVVATTPPANAYVGVAVSVAVRLLLADGLTPVAGKPVSFTVTGPASAAGCAGALCDVTTDASGFAPLAVTATGAGTITLGAVEAASGSNSITMSFAAIARPDTMQLVSAPAGSGLVGDTLPTAFAVRVFQGDGVTAAAGRSVTFSVTTGQASFMACAASLCTVQTDASGLATTAVVPLAAGAVTIQATEAGKVLTASFTAVPRPDVLQLVTTPGATVHVGAAASTPFAIRLLLADGVTPVQGVAITFQTAGRGAGAVQFGACTQASCTLLTDASGTASTTITGALAGSVTLVAAADPASGAGSVSWAFQVVANDDSLNALEAVTYVAEGATLEDTLHVSATANGAAATSLPITWTGAGSMRLQQVQATTDGQGNATAEVAMGPLAAGASASATACAWSNVCAAFQAIGVAQSVFGIAIVSGGQQAATNGSALIPVTANVTDSSGHPVAAASVTIYQTMTAFAVLCPPQGRCPAQPVLATKVTVATSDVSGMVAVPPLTVAGAATQTEMSFSVGTAGFATAVVTSQP